MECLADQNNLSIQHLLTSRKYTRSTEVSWFLEGYFLENYNSEPNLLLEDSQLQASHEFFHNKPGMMDDLNQVFKID